MSFSLCGFEFVKTRTKFQSTQAEAFATHLSLGQKIKIFVEFLRKRFRTALAVAYNVRRFPGYQQLARFAVNDLVTKMDRAPLGREHASANPQRIVITRGTPVAAFRLDNHDKRVILNFH